MAVSLFSHLLVQGVDSVVDRVQESHHVIQRHVSFSYSAGALATGNRDLVQLPVHRFLTGAEFSIQELVGNLLRVVGDAVGTLQPVITLLEYLTFSVACSKVVISSLAPGPDMFETFVENICF